MKNKKISNLIRVIIIQIFFFTQILSPNISLSSRTNNLSLRRIRELTLSQQSTAEDEILKEIQQISEKIAPTIAGVLGAKLGKDLDVALLCDALTELSITYGATEQELVELAEMVITNIEKIIPGTTLISLQTPADLSYILPWIKVAVEIAVRENTSSSDEVANYMREIFETLREKPQIVNDVKELLGVEELDFGNFSQVSELAEYTRLYIIQNELNKILEEQLGPNGAKYEGVLGAIVQISNWMQTPRKVVLSKFQDLISGIAEIEGKVSELIGSNSPEYVIPWIAFGLLEGSYGELNGRDLVNRLLTLIEIAKDSQLQNETAQSLGVDSIDFANQNHILYLGLNAEMQLMKDNIKLLLEENNLGTPDQRETLSTYLLSIAQIFDKSEQDIVEMAKESFANVETVLDDISTLCNKQIGMDSKEVLPWIWLDLVLKLDPEANTNIQEILSKADEARLRDVANYVLSGEFNPSDISHIALLVPMAELVGDVFVTDPVETSPPISLDELETIVKDSEIQTTVDEVIAEIEDNFAGQDYDIDKVRKALVFITLIKGWAPEALIPDLTSTELMMAYTASGRMSSEQAGKIYSKAVDIIRNTRRDGIDTTLPPKVEPSGFNWKSALFRFASTLLAAGIATGVFLGGASEYSSQLFQAWLAFLTYVNVKPIVELGLSGIVDMFTPHTRAPEEQDIIKNGVPEEHKGIVLRQMYVVKDKQLRESVLIGEWLKQQFDADELQDEEIIREKIASGEIKDPNIKWAIVIDVDTEEFRQKTIDAYNQLLQKYPGIENYVFLFIRNKGNWQFKEAYNRKEGRIDDLLAFIYKGINHPETHLEGPKADLRARDRNGNVRILGDNFYIDGRTRELKDKEGNVIRDEKGNPITEDRIQFVPLYVIRDGKLYGAYGNLIAGENEFIVDKERGIIRFIYGAHTDPGVLESIPNPYTKPFKEIPFTFLLEDGKLYKGSELISDNPQFVGSEGQIMVDALTGGIIRANDGGIIRGNYIGLDLRRDPFEPLFSYIAGNVKELGILMDQDGRITGVDNNRRVRYFFVIDEDTTLPPGTIRKMIAKFAHPDNAQYVIMQPALKNTNAYQSMFTRVDTLAREMLRFSEFTNWRIFGGIMYGKWGARVDDYYKMLVEKEVADPTARSEDERPTLYVPVLGLTDVFWGDEPKATFYQFLARMKEWTIGDIQTLLKEYIPRMLWGVPYRIYSAITGKEYHPLPKLSAQGQRILTNLARSIYMPASFAALLASYFVAGNISGLYTLTGRTVSNLITAGIVLGAIIGLGKWIAPIVRDLREQGFSPSDNLRTFWEDTKRAWKEFWWSTGLYIPFIWLKSWINWQAYQEIKRADREMRMVPRTPGVIIAEMEKIANLPASYRKLGVSPVVGSLAITDLAIVNPMALVGLIPIGFAFLFQPTLAFLTERTTDSLGEAMEDIENRDNRFRLIGEALREVYQKKAEETMADEKLDRVLRLEKRLERKSLGWTEWMRLKFARVLTMELDYDKIINYLNNNVNPALKSRVKDSMWRALTSVEQDTIRKKFESEEQAKEALYDYLEAVYTERARIEQESLRKMADEARAIQAFKIRAYCQTLIQEYPGKPNLVNAAKEVFDLMNEVSNVERVENVIQNLIQKYSLSTAEADLLRYCLEIAGK